MKHSKKVVCTALIVLASLYMRIKWGYFIYALGGSRSAARISGLPINLVSVLTYALASLLAAFAGFLFAARVGTGDPDTGTWLALDSIAACTIGVSRT